MFKTIIAAAALCAVSMGAHAATNLLADGDFESTGADFAGGSFCYFHSDAAVQDCGSVIGWSGSTGLPVITTGAPEWGVPSSVAGFDPSVQGQVVVGIQKTGTLVSDVTLGVGVTYTLSWLDANRDGFAAQSYAVAAGGVSLGTFTTDTAVAGWAAHSLTFTATGTTPLTFAGLSGDDATAFVDNVSLTQGGTTSPVPEPSSAVLALAGLLALAGWRGRRQAGRWIATAE